jgi:signal transduction histidine kinase/CheY-like chemotaxis protein
VELELSLPVLYLDSDLKVVDRNRAALDEIPGSGASSQFRSLLHPDDWSELGERLESSEPYLGRLRARLISEDDPTGRWFELAFGQLDGTRLCILRDIHSEVGQFERELQEKASALAGMEHAQLARNRFLDIMSHELRTPLTAILGLSEALELGLYGDCSEEQKEAIRTINECGASLLRLINDILDVTKLETHKLKLQLEPLHAGDFCKSVLGLNAKFAREKEIVLTSDLEIAQFHFEGDRRRLKQAVSHLLDNAIKFTNQGGNVVLEVTREDQDVLFSVYDRGPGISADELPTLLTTFQQSDQGLSRLHGGAGLGLRLAKRLVDIMNGVLEVRNRSDGGACFSITLRGAFLEEEKEQRPSCVRGEGTILVVDDHKATAKLLRDALTTWGFEVETFAQVSSFKARSSHLPTRAVFMDGKLPDGSGIDCIDWMREQPDYKDLPIVFMTASEGLEVKQAAMAAGASAHLQKPVKLIEIAHCLDYLLG